MRSEQEIRDKLAEMTRELDYNVAVREAARKADKEYQVGYSGRAVSRYAYVVDVLAWVLGDARAI